MQHQVMNTIKQTHFAVLSALPKILRGAKILREAKRRAYSRVHNLLIMRYCVISENGCSTEG